jgi:peptidoglycan hydrolase-like protein with peptidoglycan-binding domain
LVVIGPAWNRDLSWLDEPESFVRMEIEMAMTAGVAMVPVLVRGATMPTADELPSSISSFAYLNAAPLEHSSWGRDMDPLLAAITSLIENGKNTVTSPEAATADGGRQNGFTGPQGYVVQIQQALNHLGYYVTVDGLFGEDTASGVRALQIEHALAPDGFVGQDTWQALGRPTDGSNGVLYPTVSIRGFHWPQLLDRGDQVRAIQRTLNRRGLPTPTDGTFGEQTKKQVMRFQEQQGLDCDGIVGRQTWQALTGDPDPDDSSYAIRDA